MKTYLKLIAGAALSAALMPMTPAAAGGGVQLNFGGPLGAFSARPHGSYGGGHSYEPRHSYHAKKSGHAATKALAEKKAAARAAKLAEARQLEAKRRQAAAERKSVAAAKAQEPEIQKASIEKVEKAEKIKAAPFAEIAEAAPVKASAIAGANTLLPVEAAGGETQTGDVQLKPIEVVSPAPDSAPQVASNGPDNSSFSPAREFNEPQSCKKFIPSAGLTITVPCSD